MQFHPLLSDWFIYALVILAAVFLGTQAKKPHVKATWRLLCQSKPAMFSAVILALFLAVTLADSLHFRSTQVNTNEPALQSLLDKLAPRLAFAHEITYSRPLAKQLSSSTHYVDKLGQRQYGQAPLRHVEHDRALLSTIVTGSAYGLAIFILLAAITYAIRRLWIKNPRQGTQWKTLAITTGCVCVLGGIAILCASRLHLFGTNKIGHDVFFESLKSIRTGVIIGTLSTVFMLPFALILGLLAGYFRGWVDDLIQFIYTTLSSIPGVLLISATVLVMQVYIHNHPGLFSSLADRADARLVALCVILGLTSWANLCRLLRAETLKVKSYDYVQVAKVMRIPKVMILAKHILPNIFHIVLITIALDFSGLVLAEAVLSYIGVGVDPTTASWGNIINSARLEMAREPTVWWTLTAAMVMMFLLVLSANLFADALRDALDPRGRFVSTLDTDEEIKA
jgi:peptide/nickel transport system permease protein